jgi:hypothetical protein
MIPSEFAAKWREVATTERAAAQSHFLDLCRLLDEPSPTDVDPTGTWSASRRAPDGSVGAMASRRRS